VKKLLLAGMILAFASSAYAAPAELPVEMVGYWMPMYDGREMDSHNWPGAMHRIPEWSYEWGISQNGWLGWDGVCNIHDVKQLGEMDYEVEATCGLTDGYPDKPPYKMDPDNVISEDRYQFTLCGEILNVRVLKDRDHDQPAEPEGCKISRSEEEEAGSDAAAEAAGKAAHGAPPSNGITTYFGNEPPHWNPTMADAPSWLLRKDAKPRMRRR
jgi:hypothetical protein